MITEENEMELDTAVLEKLFVLARSQGLSIRAAQITEAISGIEIAHRLEFDTPNQTSGMAKPTGNL